MDSNTGSQVITKTKVINANSNFTNTKVLAEAATKTVTKEITVTHTYTTTKRVPRKADKETKATGLKEDPIYFQTQPTQAPDIF